jgi:MFS family permease
MTSDSSSGAAAAERVQDSPWAPFASGLFRALWIATVASNIGTWMHEVGAVWLMTDLSADPLLVALIQSATALPVFVFALPAGALADMLDRRRYLLRVQFAMAAVAVTLALLAWFGHISPWALLVFTFLLGCGAAFNAPAWQAVIAELVPPPQLPAAVAINSMGINVSRAVGPALGGLLVALYGPSLAFALNALSFAGIITILLRWRRTPAAAPLPAERFASAMRMGLRYASESPPLRVVLARALAFFPFASAVWALLPLAAKGPLGQEAGGFGLLLAAIGAGAIGGAALLPRLRQWLSAERRLLAASLLTAACAAGLAVATQLAAALPVMLLMGMAWITVLSTLNVAAQQAAPAWVRGRVLSIYLVAFFGCMAFGSGLWGQLAKSVGIEGTLLMAALGQILGVVLSLRLRLDGQEPQAIMPSSHWPEPVVEMAPEPDQGPVLISVEYDVIPGRMDEFLAKGPALRRMRRQGGAFFWSLFADMARPNRLTETFMTESWLEHLRQHHRTTQADRTLQDGIRPLLEGGDAPKVSHFIAVPQRRGHSFQSRGNDNEP